MKRFIENTKGVVLVYVLLVLLPILGMAGFAVDSAHLTFFKARLQNTADAASLAGITELGYGLTTLEEEERTAIFALAKSYADLNMSVADYGHVVTTSSMQIGMLDIDGEFGTEGQFYPEGTLPVGGALNALRVVAQRTEANTNPVRNMFITALGYETSDVVAVSTAAATYPFILPPCVGNGMMALGDVDVSSQSLHLSGSCAHAEGALKLGSNACIQRGETGEAAAFSTPNPDDIHVGQNIESVEHEDECGTMLAETVDINDYLYVAEFADYLLEPENFIFDLSLPANDPGHVESVETFIDNYEGSEYDLGWPACDTLPSKGNTTTLDQDVNIENCVLYVDGDVDFKRQGNGPLAFENVIILAKGDVKFSSDTTLGTIATCDTISESTSLIVASGSLHAPAKMDLYGTQIILGEGAHVSAQGESTGGSILSGGDLTFTAQFDAEGCVPTSPPLDFPEAADEDPKPYYKLSG